MRTKQIAKLRRKAEQGDASAQHHLGEMCAQGRDVPQDDARAVMWYQKAAAQGHVRAQDNLGVQYHQGLGVPQDNEMARQWWEQAAAQGLAAAMNNLGAMYAEGGQSVPQDNLQAYLWYSLAIARLTGAQQKFTVDNREKVARRMTPAQLAEVQRLTQQPQAQQFRDC